MDRLDIRIVEALQAEGDLTHARLAARVGSTPTTCLRRVRRLRAAGVLTACTYVTDPARLGRGLTAIITVRTRDHPKARRTDFAKAIEAERAVTQAWGVTGEQDAVLVGHFANMAEYQSVCDRLFDADENVVRYTTHFVAETYVANRPIPCDFAGADR